MFNFFCKSFDSEVIQPYIDEHFNLLLRKVKTFPTSLRRTGFEVATPIRWKHIAKKTSFFTFIFSLTGSLLWLTSPVVIHVGTQNKTKQPFLLSIPAPACQHLHTHTHKRKIALLTQYRFVLDHNTVMHNTFQKLSDLQNNIFILVYNFFIVCWVSDIFSICILKLSCIKLPSYAFRKLT